MSAANSPRRTTSRGETSTSERVRSACRLRDEWFGHGLSTAPSDRATAEAAVREVYRLIGEPAPEFVWVPSPTAAADLLRDRPADPPVRLTGPAPPNSWSGWPVADRIAFQKTDMRARMIEHVRRSALPGWWRFGWTRLEDGDPLDAIAAGHPPSRVVDVAVHAPLVSSLRDAIWSPLRKAFLGEDGETGGRAARDQYDVWGIGFFDAWQRSGLGRFRSDDTHLLNVWATLARSTGWWWPGRGRCVMAERPVALHVEATPGGRHGEIRLHHADRHAVEFGDGTGLHAVHGTVVPDWVVAGPTVERIHAEPNVEIRRTAIERLGWDAYIGQAELQLLSTAADPGNPGSELQLYFLPTAVWGAPSKILLCVNGSLERDGHRRRYGLNVPIEMTDPVAAAGWSYGLTGEQYAQLVRRT